MTKNIYLFIFSVLTHTEKCKVIAELCSKLSELFFFYTETDMSFFNSMFHSVSLLKIVHNDESETFLTSTFINQVVQGM